MYLDLNYRLYLVRSLFFRRASQNVVSPGKRPDAPGAADHLRPPRRRPRPAPSSRPGAPGAFARLAQRSPFPLGPFRLLFWSLALLLPLLGAADGGRRLGADLGAPAPPHPGPAGRRSSPWSRSSSPAVVPGANDNASGVATAISLADELDARAAREPRRLGRARRRRGVPAGGDARVRARAPQAARAADAPSSSRSTRSAAATSASRPAPAGSSATRWTAAWSSSARRSPRPTPTGERPLRRRRFATASPATRCRRGCAGWRSIGITCLDADGYVPPPPPAHRHAGDDRPAGARPRPRLRARADPPARRRPRPAGGDPGRGQTGDRSPPVSETTASGRAASCSGSPRRRRSSART